MAGRRWRRTDTAAPVGVHGGDTAPTSGPAWYRTSLSPKRAPQVVRQLAPEDRSSFGQVPCGTAPVGFCPVAVGQAERVWTRPDRGGRLCPPDRRNICPATFRLQPPRFGWWAGRGGCAGGGEHPPGRGSGGHRAEDRAMQLGRQGLRAQPGKATGVGARVSPRSCSDASRQ
jgi:hypothetical protein